MPEIDKGYIVVPVESLIREPTKIEVFMSLARDEECKCFIVDTPFVATLNVKGFVVDQVIGVGSIVCTPNCELREGYRIEAPTWGYGRLIGGKCVLAGDIEGANLLGMLGYDIHRMSLAEAIEEATRGGKRTVIYLPSFEDRLYVSRSNGRCGRLYTFNPLHPAGAFGKPRHTTCLHETYELVGPYGKYASPLLAVEYKPFLYHIAGMGEALVIGARVEDLDAITSTAVWLGILYTCGREA
jgi:hypothetical protein